MKIYIINVKVEYAKELISHYTISYYFTNRKNAEEFKNDQIKLDVEHGYTKVDSFSTIKGLEKLTYTIKELNRAFNDYDNERGELRK